MKRFEIGNKVYIKNKFDKSFTSIKPYIVYTIKNIYYVYDGDALIFKDMPDYGYDATKFETIGERRKNKLKSLNGSW